MMRGQPQTFAARAPGAGIGAFCPPAGMPREEPRRLISALGIDIVS